MSTWRLTRWLLARDPGLRGARRAGRTAVVMPAMFAIGSELVGNAMVATFAAFGSFALLLLADFGGTLRERLASQATLVGVGAVFVCLGTLASGNAWTAALAMLVVGFAVLFAGVVSSVLAGASTAALLAFILPVATPGGAGTIPDRLAGWLLAGAVSLPAVALLWPAPRTEPLRDAAATACRALSARLSTEATAVPGLDDAAIEAAVRRSDEAVAGLRAVFLATPYRPSGLSTAARAVVRLVDEVGWLSVVLDDAASRRAAGTADPTVAGVDRAAAVLLEHAGKVLGQRDQPQDSLQDHLDDLARARAAMEAAATGTVRLPDGEVPAGLPAALAPGFHAQELSFAAAAIAGNIEVTAAAERRSWWQALLGSRPDGVAGPLASARERASAHVEPHSVWLHNSIRGAFGLAIAVLVADLSGVQHSFWIVLGALSVLRSNALSTGQSALRGLLGTTTGFAVGGLLVLAIGSNTTVLWVLLPVAVLVAGVAPAVSFAAGQAGFTVALVILFNIVSPAGWEVGLVRIEDVALGCAVSLVVGALFWPRGAGAALSRALAEAYADAAADLRAAAESGAGTGAVAGGAGADLAVRSAAAARRLDDAFREFLAERGPKRLGLAEVTALLTGVAGLRLTADAVRDLWSQDRRGPHPVRAPRTTSELIAGTERVTNWYAALAQAAAGSGTVPRALPPDGSADGRLVEALRQDLADTSAPGTSAPGTSAPGTSAPGTSAPDGVLRGDVVRLVWTADHVDAARRLQAAVEAPARTVASRPRTARPEGLPEQRRPVPDGAERSTR